MSSVSRLIDFLQVRGESKAAFYKKTGFSNGYLDKVKELGADKIEIIVSKYADLNLNWLITGIGPMRLNYRSEISGQMVMEEGPYIMRSPVKSRFNKLRDGAGLINFYDVDFAAGDVEFFDDMNHFTPAYTMDIPEFNGCTAFRAYNNSMEKLIFSGDILFATKEDDWHESLEYGQIYGIVCKNRRKYLKYIRRAEGKETTHFLLKSENSEEYDDFVLAKKKIKSIWLIHGWLKKRV